eukprot:3941292-Rhodomonas_salina.3
MKCQASDYDVEVVIRFVAVPERGVGGEHLGGPVAACGRTEHKQELGSCIRFWSRAVCSLASGARSGALQLSLTPAQSPNPQKHSVPRRCCTGAARSRGHASVDDQTHGM